MASKLAKNSLCIFCYTQVPTPQDDQVDRSNTKKVSKCSSKMRLGLAQTKFLLLLSRYLKFHQFSEGRLPVPPSELRICQDCSEVGDSFSELFIQLETIQLQLSWQLRTISERITLSEETPSKVNQFHTQFACSDGDNDNLKLGKLGKDIKQLRKDLLQHCDLILNPDEQPQPNDGKSCSDDDDTQKKGIVANNQQTETDENHKEVTQVADDDNDNEEESHVSEIEMEVEPEGNVPFPDDKDADKDNETGDGDNNEDVELGDDDNYNADDGDDDDDDDDNQEENGIKKFRAAKHGLWAHPDLLPSTECEVCHQNFVSEAAVEKHRALVHNLRQFIRCQGCGQTFACFKYLSMHRNRPTQPNCFIPNIKFLEPASISEFPQYCWGTERNYCPHEGCYEIFKFDEHLKIHLKTHGSWNCLHCEMTFDKAHYLAWHEITQHNEEGSEATDSNGEPIYKCNRCISQKKNKKRWIINHFVSKHLGVCTVPEKTEGGKLKQCPICKRPFGFQTPLKDIEKHVKKEHDIEGLDPSLVYNCSVCQVPFLSSRYLTQHMRLVHKQRRRYKCSVCDKTFSSSVSLRKHCRISHKGSGAGVFFGSGLPGKFACHLCNEKFGLTQQLACHIEWHERNGQEQKYPCKECDVIFTRKDSLRRHLKEKHAPGGKTAFCCGHCGKFFGRKDRLVQHERTHSNSEPFHCALCDESFKSNSSLKSHMRKMHEETTVEVEMVVVDSNLLPDSE